MSRRFAKVWEEMRRAAEAQGWELSFTRGGHIRWQPPQGSPVISPATPGGGRSIDNTRALLIRAGLDMRRSR